MNAIFKEYLFTKFRQQKEEDLLKECFIIYRKMLNWEAQMKLEIDYPLKKHHMEECKEMQNTICRVINEELGYDQLLEFLKNF